MCTSASFLNEEEHCFGRNLDLEMSLGQQVVVTPRNYPFRFRAEPPSHSHKAMIGTAIVTDGYPLYFDAVNEGGLGMAGLNFPGEAVYRKREDGKHNVSPFEFIPWVLGQCSSVEEARVLLGNTVLIDEPFDERFPLSPLHWMIADRSGSLVVESTASGLDVYDDPADILTNCPPFPFHMRNLASHMNLSAGIPENRIARDIDLTAYSRGMGAFGLPGDLSSASRFVKAAFTLHNSVADRTPEGTVTQFFHILDSVQQQKGCCDLGDGKYEHTVYSSCCDTARGIYYFRTYGNSRIVGIDMHGTDLDSDAIASYPMSEKQDILMLNRNPLRSPDENFEASCIAMTRTSLRNRCMEHHSQKIRKIVEPPEGFEPPAC